jgi:hydrogenase nickel incorporation protein HypA/HybF
VHELSICTAICGIVLRHADGRPVDRVCIDVGGLRQVVPQTLIHCWEIVIADTELAGSALEVNHIPPTIECADCGERTVLEHPVFRCSACRGTNVTVTAGNELNVTSLVLQEA